MGVTLEAEAARSGEQADVAGHQRRQTRRARPGSTSGCCGILSGDGVVHQHAVIAGVGDIQAGSVGQGETRKIQRRSADGRVGRIAVDIRAVGGAQDGVIVRDSGDHILLADLDVGRLTVRGRNGVPDQDAAEAQIGDEQMHSVAGHRSRD